MRLAERGSLEKERAQLAEERTALNQGMSQVNLYLT